MRGFDGGIALNVLVVLNEQPMGSHPDVYEALRLLNNDGLLSRWAVYPHAQRLREVGSPDVLAGEILRAAALLPADVIVWMHTARMAITAGVLTALRALPTTPVMAYWEQDSYHPRYKPLPLEMLALMQACDLVFLPCGGPIIDALNRAGCTAVRYAPSCASGTRFPHAWEPPRAPTFDVVMIGNRVVSRRPGRTMPGAKQRIRLARALEKRYGARFGLFGNGWRGRSAQGPCAFNDQSHIYAESLVGVGVNNSTWPLVFSNRLPISLATGIPTVYSANPGFDRVFDEEFNDVFFRDEAEALARIDELLKCDPAKLRALSMRNRTFFERNLTTVAVCRHVLAQAQALRTREAAATASSAPVSGDTPAARWSSLPPLPALHRK